MFTKNKSNKKRRKGVYHICHRYFCVRVCVCVCVCACVCERERDRERESDFEPILKLEMKKVEMIDPVSIVHTSQ